MEEVVVQMPIASVSKMSVRDLKPVSPGMVYVAVKQEGVQVHASPM